MGAPSGLGAVSLGEFDREARYRARSARRSFGRLTGPGRDTYLPRRFSDGYGIDRCLASGEPCGAAAASALCRAREYAKAVDFGRIDPAEITGGVPAGTQVSACKGRSCPDMVAITCSR